MSRIVGGVMRRKSGSAQQQASPSRGSASPRAHVATIYQNLEYCVKTEDVQHRAHLDQHKKEILKAYEARHIFHVTPPNMHLDLGKDKNELEMLMDKFKSEFEQLVPSMCDALEAVIQAHQLQSRRHSRMASKDGPEFSSFDTSAVPEIGLEDYLWRIVDYTYISPTSMVLACILIDRLIVNQGLMLSRLNVYKLFFTAVRVASKVHELRSLSNKNFAVVGGVTTEQMNNLESKFVTHFTWDLWVEHDDFSAYCVRLMPKWDAKPIEMIPM